MARPEVGIPDWVSGGRLTQLQERSRFWSNILVTISIEERAPFDSLRGALQLLVAFVVVDHHVNEWQVVADSATTVRLCLDPSAISIEGSQGGFPLNQESTIFVFE